MNAIATRRIPEQLSVATRAGVAFAAVAVIAAGSLFAGEASEQAVRSAQAALNPAIRYIVLPTVEVMAKRNAADVADVSCASPHAKS